MASGITYVIKTDLPPEGVNQIAMEIFQRWVDFALGNSAIGGKRLIYPTGRYAASISYKQEGESAVAIVADEDFAPEVAILEHGHGPVDLKTKLRHGFAYPMHRFTGSTPGTKLRRVGSGPSSMQPKMWAEVRAREASGYASIGPNSPADSWIIPAMPAYSPALMLAGEIQARVRGLA